MRKGFVIILLFIVSFPTISFAQNLIEEEINAKEIIDHIQYLASDELEGRFTGSEGCYAAGEYIKNEFESYGLTPLFGDSFFQKFPFIEKADLTENNFLTIIIAGKEKNLELETEYITAPFSGTSDLESEIVFVGYGLSVPSLEYDDYKGVDVKDKIVMAMRYHPQHDNPMSKFDMYASFRQKASTARDKGAKGIIFVNPYEPLNDDKLTNLKYDGAAGITDFAVVQMKREFVDQIFKSNDLDFAEYQKGIDDEMKPASFTFLELSAKLKTEVVYVEKMGRNVGAILEGNDPELKNEYIVIGAHYDHLGLGQTSSRYRGPEKLIHNGADDNASGTVGVIELAEKFASIKNEIKRSIIFTTFSGEELGLLGSSYLVRNFPKPIENVTAMLNMDMIGRLDEENNLTVIGTGTSSVWKNLLTEKNVNNFKLTFNEDGFGGSDHMPFVTKGIPALFFFTGIHEDYHMPDDDTEKIIEEKQELIVKYVFNIGYEIANKPERLDYVKVEKKTRPGGMGRSKIKVGTIPEFSYQGAGYKISGVTEGSPAQKAGLQAGDIMIKFAGKQVDSIYDFMGAMNGVKAGDTVDIVVLRDGEEMTFKAELKAN